LLLFRKLLAGKCGQDIGFYTTTQTLGKLGDKPVIVYAWKWCDHAKFFRKFWTLPTSKKSLLIYFVVLYYH